MDDFARVEVKRAREGDTDAAREVLQAFITAVDIGSEVTWTGPMHYVQARYIADAFRKILAVDPKDDKFPNLVVRALGLRYKRGRPPRTTNYDDQAIAAMYHFLIGEGEDAADVKRRIAAEIGCREITVRRAIKECGWPTELSSDKNFLRSAFIPYREALVAIRRALQRERLLRGGSRDRKSVV